MKLKIGDCIEFTEKTPNPNFHGKRSTIVKIDTQGCYFESFYKIGTINEYPIDQEDINKGRIKLVNYIKSPLYKALYG